MVEPFTSATGLYLASRAVKRLLGPTTDVVAQALAKYTEIKLRNALLVIENATSKKNNSHTDEKVSPRIAMRVLEEGSYSDEPIVVEYLGGVLASSSTPSGRDDRGNVFIALASRLASYHLRAHFVIYRELYLQTRGMEINVFHGDELTEQGMLYIPERSFVEAMQFSPDEDVASILTNAFSELYHEGLARVEAWGTPEHLDTALNPIPAFGTHRREWPGRGLVIAPTGRGLELLMWAIGRGTDSLMTFFLPDITLPDLDDIPLIVGASRVQQVPVKKQGRVAPRRG